MFETYPENSTSKLCIIISPLVGSGPPDKYSYEIGRLFADPLTVHSVDPSERERDREQSHKGSSVCFYISV